jgi:hypothetical protein
MGPLGFEVLAAVVMKSTACSLLRDGLLLGHSCALKMEATYYSEMSIEFQRTTQRYILEDKALQGL